MWGDRSEHASYGGIGFMVECPIGEIEGCHGHLKGTGETLCESLLRLCPSYAKTSVFVELIEPSGVSLSSSSRPLFGEVEGGDPRKDSGDAEDNRCEDRKGETSGGAIL